jgi:hypothetical protein
MPQLTGPQVYTTQINTYDRTLVTDNPDSWYKTLIELRKHPTIKIARFMAVAPAVISKWTTEGKADDEIHDHLIKHVIPHQTSIVSDAMLGMMDWGWAAFERVLTDDQIFHALKPMMHILTTLLVDIDNGNLIGFMQEETQYKEEVELYEPDAVIFTQNVEGQEWYGHSDMESAQIGYDSWKAADTVAKKYDEKTAGAHWVVKYPLGKSLHNGQDKDNGEIARDILNSLTSNGNIAIPQDVQRWLDIQTQGGGGGQPQWSIELMESTASTSTSLDTRLRYCDIMMLRGFCMPERMLTEGRHGTKAEAETHADVAMTYIEMKRDHVLDRMNKTVVKEEITTHFGPEFADSVKLIPEPLNADQRQYLREVYSSILASPEGFMAQLDDIDIDALRDQAGVPTIDKMV